MKEEIGQFTLGTLVENTQQISYYFGKQGTVVSARRVGNKDSVQVQYTDGSTETHTGAKVWLRPLAVGSHPNLFPK